MEVDIEKLDFAALNSMSVQDYKEALGNKAIRAKIEEILTARNTAEVTNEEITAPSTEEETQPVDAEEQARSEAQAVADAEAVRVAAEVAQQAETERLALEEAARIAVEEAARPKRYVMEFQATDTDGNPIGKVTHLEAPSQEELLEKMKQSYVNAVRALEKAKRQKPVYKQEEIIRQVTQAEMDQAAEDLKSTDLTKRADAVRKLASVEINKELAESRAERETARQAKESLIFLGRHTVDYNNCQANNQILANYIQDNKLEWSADNLEIALDTLENQLAPVVKTPVVVEPVQRVVVNPTQTVTPAAPVAVVAVAPITPVAPVAPAVIAAPPTVVPVVQVPNIVPVQPVRRPGVNAGVIPGQTTRGVRPAATTPALTKKDIALMPRDEFRKRLRNPDFAKLVNTVINQK